MRRAERMPRRRRVYRPPSEAAEGAETIYLPTVPVNDTVLFPRMVVPLTIGRERTMRAVDDAMLRDRTVVVVAQRDPDKEDVGASDLYSYGTEAVIGRVLKMPDGTTNILVQGQRRVRIVG